MATRIITGTRKGKKLENPAKGTRPLTDRIKTSLFDLIKDFIEGAEILDLYAGGGNFGIEALSRGAEHVDFVDKADSSARIIHKNLTETEFQDQSSVFVENVQDYVREVKKLYDIVFADPPFDNVNLRHIEDASKILKKDGILIFRHPTKLKSPEKLHELTRTYQKKYGISTISFYQNT